VGEGVVGGNHLFPFVHFRKKEYIGFDLGARGGRAVEVQGRAGSWQVSSASVHPLPPGAIRDGTVLVPEAVVAALEQLAASAQRAAHLMEQLLTLARLDPAAPLPMVELRLDQLAAEVCAEQGAQALAKDITLELAATEAAPLMGNEAMLRVLLRNLIDNAIRYTPQGGRVVVTITHRAGRLTLAVCDDGPGISPELRPLALERFHRLAGQDTEGSGLGLSIATRIAELHGARLELDEGLDGHGLCVRVQFAGHR